MRLGIHLPFKGPDSEVLDGKAVMQVARDIEDAGFDGIWIGDGLAAMARPDPLSWLLTAANATEHIEVGTCVLQVPLRDPAELAQRMLTLHTLTNGRFSFGVGSGSGAVGYKAVGGDFEGRFKKLNHDLKVIKQLCNGETVDGTSLHVWPSALGGPPILIGAWSSEVWVKRAAQDYDGWMCSGSFHRSKARGDETTFKTLASNLQKYRDLGGKRALISSVMIDLSQPEQHLGDDEPFHMRCGPKSAAERLERVREIGYDDILLVKAEPGRNIYEAYLTPEELATIRSLLSPQRETAGVR